MEENDKVSACTFKKLVDRSNDIILLTNGKFRVEYVNDAVYTVLGYRIEDVVGKSLFQLLGPAKASILESFIAEGDKKISANGLTEVAIQSKDGKSIHFDIDLMDMRLDPEVKGWVITLYNISKRKRIEEKLLKTNTELDHFVYRTSHDLRAPLLSALGLIELAKRDDEWDKEGYLKMIEASLNKLDVFIESINRFYSNEKLTVRKEVVDFDFMLQNAITGIKNMDPTGNIDIKYTLGKISDLYSDPNRLKIIIENVLSNSVKYSDDEKTASYVNIDIQITPDRCKLRFDDNGIGIRKERLNRIFDIFYRADEGSQGSGLGLYVVKDAIDKLGGHIEVQSEYGNGSSFIITIPNFLGAEIAGLKYD
ncbi:PAS domain S-box protein [Fulvivirga sp. M361]|uniref:PAS domain-containing sensor histidine kinase n=1 Tax=Fulvivirga sp. M361 TaxID=2594266 RepID=UPI00117B9CD8|nr:PAS domain-containing sensor histidine kinase [Fulvivirga sp. M361]TRX53780.1 PAS domain S-box protein [Fulvivirga sp. M361]